MNTNLSIRRSPSRYSLLLVLLLTLIGILGGCGGSTTAGPSHPSGATPTSTPTRELKGTISEFPLPSSIFWPTYITKGPDGNLWFNAGGTIGRITPTGVIRLFSIPTQRLVAAGITDGPDGNLWFSEELVPGGQSGKGKIGRITLSGTISEFSLSSNSNPGNITTGPDRALWFDEYDINNKNYKIGRITTTGTISEFPLPFPPQTYLYGITTGSDGNFWGIGYNGNNVPKGMIWRITPTGTISAFPLPTAFFPSGSLIGIIAGPDGNLWFGESDSHSINGKIGRITPSGTISEFPLPDHHNIVNDITAGPDGNLWFTESTDSHNDLTSQNGKIGRITASGTITEFPVPTSNGTPWGITAGLDSTILFTEISSNKIGRLV